MMNWMSGSFILLIMFILSNSDLISEEAQALKKSQPPNLYFLETTLIVLLDVLSDRIYMMNWMSGSFILLIMFILSNSIRHDVLTESSRKTRCRSPWSLLIVHPAKKNKLVRLTRQPMNAWATEK